MSRSPNDEQLVAIESEQGALLSAGAGSGKTFVIVHHVLFYINRILESEFQNTQILQEEREKNIARRISEIVIMTFTRKAAGELAARIKGELKHRSQTDQVEHEKWLLVKKYSDYMTIGTIDSFCSKVLKAGIISHVDNHFDIISQNQRDWEFERVLKKQIIKTSKQPLLKNDLALKRYKDIIGCFLEVFKDSTTRFNWENSYHLELKDLFTEKLFEQLFERLGLMDFWSESVPDCLLVKHEKKAWFQAVAKIEELKSQKLYLPEVFSKVMAISQEFNLRGGPQAKRDTTETMAYYDKLKTFKDNLKSSESGESILATFQQMNDPNSALNSWWQLIQNIFPMVLKGYEELDGMTFSDLNITLLKSLNDPEVCSKIAQKYRYFIVDEFQDTSMIQYEIILKIIGGDHERLFAVGDKKQAIYGFRGGELNVFERCSDKAKLNHSLLNNYRSSEQITSFNNIFFDHVMHLGPKFEGFDKYHVEFEPQKTPAEMITNNASGITYLKVSDEEKRDFTSSYVISQLEAELFAKKIKNQSPYKSLAILYTKLNLSYDLIEKLIDQGISFTAQVQLKLDEEPILELLKVFLGKNKTKASQKKFDSQEYFSLMYYTVCERLNIKPQMTSHDAYESFINEKAFWGIKLGFYKILIKIGFSISQTEYNLNVFEIMLRECRYDEDQLLAMLKMRNQGKHNVSLMFGDFPERVSIMTVHASKGLEFDTVLLGGIYANGITPSDTDMMGKEPGSFKWFQDVSSKDKFKTPVLLEESFLKKEKDFSERKRLLYVACTRAKNELGWCDFPIEKLSKQDNAWYKPLSSVRDKIAHLVTNETYEVEHNIYIKNNVFKKSELPLYHRDNIGITKRLGGEQLDFAILPEISVKRLSILATCPRKFYLSEILKIDFKSISKFGYIDQSKEIGERNFISGLERGTQIHKQVEKYLEDGETGSDDSITWLAKQLEKFPKKTWSYRSEVLHKFDLYGYMMTGIPDLLLIKDDELVIWDFKTGLMKSEAIDSYWFQLMLYAWPYREKFKKIEIALVYLDEKKIVSREIDRLNLLETIDCNLSKIKNLFEKNERYCQECLYNNLCNKPLA